MKRIFYKFMLMMIVFFGLMVGIVKGQEARQKWVSKKKNRYEHNRFVSQPESAETSLVLLDEFEMATYHR